MKRWKHWVLISNGSASRRWGLRCLSLLSGLSMVLLPVPIAGECTPGKSGFRGYSLLSPAIVNPEIPSAPLFLNFQAIYEQFGGQAVAQERDNVTEWQERFCSRASKSDIHFLIYNTEIADLEQLRVEMKMSGNRFSYPFTDNSFAKYLKRQNCEEVLDYFIFAKRCEKHVIAGSDPWRTPPRDTIAMRVLMDEGTNLFRNTKSHYVRLRYAYQIIRLAHYAKDYAGVLSRYDFLMPQIDHDPSIIEYWIKGHYAGALMALGRNVQASYLYALIFENCPSKAESAFRSFKINTDEEWLACEKLCQSDRERATLYALRARAADSKALEEMRRIYELDPRNRHLEVLLVNEMYKLEKDLLGYGFNDEKAHNRRLGYPRARAGEYVIGLQDFVRQVLDEGQITRPGLWRIALGYLETLAGNYYDAIRTFEIAKQQVKDPALQEQLAVFEMVMRISAFTVATDSVEREVNRIRRSDLFRKYRDLPDFLSDKMTQLYEQGDSPGKAFLSNYRMRDLRANPKKEVIDDLLALCRKPSRNSLENALVLKSDGSTIEKDLLNIKGTLLFSEGQLEEALTVFKDMERSNWVNYGVFNPFITRFNDCVNCPLPDTANMYSRGELIERLLSMESLIRAGSDRTAEYYFQLGAAFYNMTYFSYAWEVMDLFRSGTSMQPAKLRAGGNVVAHPAFPLGNREVFDCSRALFYFEKARQTATDPEMAARAAYWAAKCERNAWYVSRAQGAQRTYDYFRILRDQHSNTRFYERVVRECKTFQAYLAKGG